MCRDALVFRTRKSDAEIATRSYAGIIFWRNSVIFSHFFAQNRMKILGVREKTALKVCRFYSILFCTFLATAHDLVF